MARGGIGLITTEAAEVDGDHLYDATILGIFDDSQIEGFKKLADSLHQYGTKLSVQLIQGGPYANSVVNEGRMPLSSSPIAHVWNPMETPTEMTHEDIKSYVDKYVAAAKRAQIAGCDAVELHCAHGHALLGSFLSPLMNHRTDEYGGDINGRARFLVEIVEAIRKAVGEDFPISVRLSAKEAQVKKNVVVIGGGPAGIEAATTAAKRGHRVTLLEKAGALCGQFIIASYPPVKQELSIGLKYLIHELKKAKVEVKLNTEATLETVKALNPDEIILATGGQAKMPGWITGSAHPNIMSAWDVLYGKKKAGLNVAVIGGGSVGCEVADFIADHHNYRAIGGRKITILEMLDNVDNTDYTANRDFLMKRLAHKPITIITSAKVSAITENSVSYVKDEKEEILKGIDTIIVAMGTDSNNGLAEELKALNLPVHVIGDAKESRKIMNAVEEGREVGISL